MANDKKRKSAANKAGRKNGNGNMVAETVLDTEIVEELEKRFLSYALSTIVSRAIPDVRDGLKPVHRRVLYAMHKLRLEPASRFRKSAAVVGDVIGKYHPHGDQAVYDTMVRLAQDFSLRYPLVDGQGNFGNIDGDAPAAMRYTESKLTPLALELLSELKKETVDFVPTYDQLLFEPAVLPARFPNLLVNGSAGIAVGLATNIPPHNMTEVINALMALLENKKLETADLLKFIKGPDFPTGAEMVVTKKELKDIYETGKGSIKVRGVWNVEEPEGRTLKFDLVITAIPYGVNKTRLIEKIADLIINGKIPDIIDIRDESTEDIRIVLEPKTAAVDPAKVMTYIFRHSELAISYPVNLTAISSDATPLRMSLIHILKSFLAFRLEVTEKRLRYDLKILTERLHILTALALIYVDLDEAISIIRKSKNRDEARQKLTKHFKIDETQANAILDLRLSALVGMEISKIRLEKAEKEAEKEQIEKVLGSGERIKAVVKKELADILRLHGDRRKTKIVTSEKDLPEYNPESFIEHEQTNVIVSRSGWIRRMKNVTNPESLRFKESDSRLVLLHLNTRDLVAFFTSAGKVYTIRAFDIVQTTGFGDPVQSFFRFADGERLVSVFGFRQGANITKLENEKNKQGSIFDQLKKSDLEKIHGSVIMQGGGTELLVAFEKGNGFRFSAESLTITNKNGRKIANVKGDDAILTVSPIPEKAAFIFALSNSGKGLLFDIAELPILTGPGGGVRLIKLKSDEHILGVKPLSPKDSIILTYLSGKDDVIKVLKLEKGARATSGRKVSSARKKLFGMIVS